MTGAFGASNFASRIAFCSLFGRAMTRYENPPPDVPPFSSCTVNPVAYRALTAGPLHAASCDTGKT
jgi:hypothetical protein